MLPTSFSFLKLFELIRLLIVRSVRSSGCRSREDQCNRCADGRNPIGNRTQIQMKTHRGYYTQLVPLCGSALRRAHRPAPPTSSGESPAPHEAESERFRVNSGRLAAGRAWPGKTWRWRCVRDVVGGVRCCQRCCQPAVARRSLSFPLAVLGQRRRRILLALQSNTQRGCRTTASTSCSCDPFSGAGLGTGEAGQPRSGPSRWSSPERPRLRRADRSTGTPGSWPKSQAARP